GRRQVAQSQTPVGWALAHRNLRKTFGSAERDFKIPSQRGGGPRPTLRCAEKKRWAEAHLPMIVRRVGQLRLAIGGDVEREVDGLCVAFFERMVLRRDFP